jgi:GNAT superfamily N-acetyltransferase
LKGERSLSIIIKQLSREDVNLISQIDRTEKVDTWLKVNEGKLALRFKKEYWYAKWGPEELKNYIKRISDELDEDGTFIGALDKDSLVGFTLLAHKFLNDEKEMQLIFLYVSKSYRRKGIASRLFSAASKSAKEKGAIRLYISATSSESTINFYLKQGCILSKTVNQRLQELEPWDIQLTRDLI